jgi:hypoxanthine-DNA glycosylase
MAAAVKAARQRGLPPVVDAATRVLILGSFPGVASLAARQYYAHPRNHFWPILAAVLDEPLVELPYAKRLERIASRGLGVWDIIVACERNGSSDAAIRDAKRGDVDRVRRVARSLAVVCFNGNTAAAELLVWDEE